MATKKASHKKTTVTRSAVKAAASKAQAPRKASVKATVRPAPRTAKGTAAPRNAAASRSAAAKRVTTARAGLRTPGSVKGAAPAHPQQLAHGLHALLHTMQTIQHFEERLCSLMHAMRRGRPSASAQRELAAVLQELPVTDYRNDVQSLLHALE